jgi:hypothetical protein
LTGNDLKSGKGHEIRMKIRQCACTIKRILSILHISKILSHLSTNAARTDEVRTEVLTNIEINGININSMGIKDLGKI